MRTISVLTWLCLGFLTPPHASGAAIRSQFTDPSHFTIAEPSKPPTSDPFYQPPAGFSETTPGTILKWRSIETPPPYFNASIKATYQILARSTDSRGNPVAVMSTLIVPTISFEKQLFSLQPAYDSACVNCPPSYIMYANPAVLFESILVQQALLQGMYVNIPDYEGFDAAFTNGLQSGQALLDSLQSVRNSHSFSGISETPNIVLAGVSGGALASEWALELQETYAPSVKIAGALLTSLTPNVTSVMETVDGTAASGLIPLGLLGLAKQYPEFSSWLSDTMVPSKAKGFMRALSMCGILFAAQFGEKNVLQDYLGGVIKTMENPILQSVIQETGIMGLRATPKVPIFMVKGTADEISPVADTDDLVDQYCADGANINYYRVVDGSHAAAGAYGFILGWAWVEQLVLGIPPSLAIPSTKGCKTSDVVLPTLDSVADALGSALEDLGGALNSTLSSLTGALGLNLTLSSV